MVCSNQAIKRAVQKRFPQNEFWAGVKTSAMFWATTKRRSQNTAGTKHPASVLQSLSLWLLRWWGATSNTKPWPSDWHYQTRRGWCNIVCNIYVYIIYIQFGTLSAWIILSAFAKRIMTALLLLNYVTYSKSSRLLLVLFCLFVFGHIEACCLRTQCGDKCIGPAETAWAVQSVLLLTVSLRSPR